MVLHKFGEPEGGSMKGFTYSILPQPLLCKRALVLEHAKGKEDGDKRPLE